MISISKVELPLACNCRVIEMSDRPSRLLRQLNKTQLNHILTDCAALVCSTMVSHTGDTISQSTHWNNTTNRDVECSTSLLHKPVAHRGKRYPIGLFRRGTVWQFRKRVPNDVISMFGRKFVSQSLKTSDYRLAVKVAVRV